MGANKNEARRMWSTTGLEFCPSSLCFGRPCWRGMRGAAGSTPCGVRRFPRGCGGLVGCPVMSSARRIERLHSGVRWCERAAAYRGEMRAPKKKPTPAKLRPWCVALMRSRTHYLGVVYAPDEKSAEAAAVVEFKIGEEQRRRMIVREND